MTDILIGVAGMGVGILIALLALFTLVRDNKTAAWAEEKEYRDTFVEYWRRSTEAQEDRNEIMRAERGYPIGCELEDEDGGRGWVVIRWNDGDLCERENDAAHPNPRRV